MRTEQQLLHARHLADQGNGLWANLSRVQEPKLSGALAGCSAGTKQIAIREHAEIDHGRKLGAALCLPQKRRPHSVA